MHRKDDPKKLVGDVQMFRIRVATAESKVKLLRDQARQAKRRHKVAKRIAQQTRKQFKRFKSELAELRRTLAKAELKLFQAGGRALARKTAKASLAAKRGPRLSKQSKSVAPKPREPGRVTRKKLPTAQAKFSSASTAAVTALDRTPRTPQLPGHS